MYVACVRTVIISDMLVAASTKVPELSDAARATEPRMKVAKNKVMAFIVFFIYF